MEIKRKMDFIHHLGEGEAVRRLEGLLEELKKEFADSICDLRQRRDGNSCEFCFTAISVINIPVAGEVVVGPSDVKIMFSLSLPFIACFFKKTIEREVNRYEVYIRERVGALLSA